MLTLKPKKLLCWTLFGFISYQMFGYLKVQTYGDVVVYKRLAKAIMKNNDYELRHVSVGDVASNILKAQTAREGLFSKSKILLTYYSVKSRTLSPNEQSVFLVVEQVSRVNPPGFDSLWGANEVRIKHEVQLVMKENHWVVSDFVDPASSVTGAFASPVSGRR